MNETVLCAEEFVPQLFSRSRPNSEFHRSCDNEIAYYEASLRFKEIVNDLTHESHISGELNTSSLPSLTPNISFQSSSASAT